MRSQVHERVRYCAPRGNDVTISRSRSPLVVAIVAIAAGILSSRWCCSGRPARSSASPRHADRAATAAAGVRARGSGQPAVRRGAAERPLDFCSSASPLSGCLPDHAGCAGPDEQALADLPAAQRPQVVFISVDPRRDTPERLAQYVRSFGPSFVGVYRQKAAIDELTQRMGVPVANAAARRGNYTVDHSARSFSSIPTARCARCSRRRTRRADREDYRASQPHDLTHDAKHRRFSTPATGCSRRSSTCCRSTCCRA